MRMRSPASVVTAISDHRAEVLRREAAALREMERAYREVTRRTAARADALARQINAMRAAGEEVPVGRLVRLERYQLLLAQVGADAERFGVRRAAPMVTQLQEENVWLAQQHAAQIERLSIGDDLAVELQRVQVLTTAPRIEAQVGLMGDGSPVQEYLGRTLPRATVDAVETAVRDVVTGDLGPREATRALVREAGKASGIGIDRAMLITRTEAMRVYRESQRQRWADSGIVQAYRRTAARDPRTCLGCIAMDGAIFPIGEEIEDHPNGRCSLVPVFIIDGEVISPWRGVTSRDWLETQDEATQLRVMGPGRFAAWKRGDVQLHEMARRVEDKSGRFGGAWVPRTVADIEQHGAMGGANARRLVERSAEEVVGVSA